MSDKKEIIYSGRLERKAVWDAGFRGELRSLELFYDLHPGIDLYETGRHLKKLIRQSGYSINEIQRLLYLSCPQPIYRWMKGKMLPTVDHLYVLAKIFRIHMEELLVQKEKGRVELIRMGRSCRSRRLEAFLTCIPVIYASA